MIKLSYSFNHFCRDRLSPLGIDIIDIKVVFDSFKTIISVQKSSIDSFDILQRILELKADI